LTDSSERGAGEEGTSLTVLNARVA
jgi:hypothetical protein